MEQLKDCLHCGGTAEYQLNDGAPGGSVSLRCTRCGMRTPSVAAGLEYAAKARALAIWNAEAAIDWPEWFQPTGAHDAYPVNAQVRHNGSRWTSLVDANIWEPGVSGWRTA